MKTINLFFITSLIISPQIIFADSGNIINCSSLEEVNLEAIALYKKQIDSRLKEDATDKSAQDLYTLGITAFCLNKQVAGMQFMKQATKLNYLPAIHFMGRYYMKGTFLDVSKKVRSTPTHFNKAVSYYKDAAQLFTKHIEEYPKRHSDSIDTASNMFIFANLSSLYLTQYLFLKNQDVNIIYYPQMIMALDHMEKTANQCLKLLLFYDKVKLLTNSPEHLIMQKYCFAATSYAAHIRYLEKISYQIIQESHVLVNPVCLSASSLVQQVRKELDNIFVAVNSWVDKATSTIVSLADSSIKKKQVTDDGRMNETAKKHYCYTQEQILFHTKGMVHSIKDVYLYMNQFSFAVQ